MLRLVLSLALAVGLAAADADPTPAPAIPGSTPAWSLPEGVPPSPSTVSGERIWQEPHFTHWPAVIYGDETRNCSFELPVRSAGTAGWIGWVGGERLPFVLPSDTDRTSGLVLLPREPGVHQAEIGIGEQTWTLPFRLADAADPWPLDHLVEGFPVDADGQPVVLRDRRRDPAVERQWQVLVKGLPRGEGKAVVIGDPLESLGAGIFEGLDANVQVAVDPRRSDHAALVALASALSSSVPKTLIWSPGNAALFLGTWSQEEERVLGVVRTRCSTMGRLPRCVLLLPPIPIDAELRETAKERRDLLARSAAFQGWQVLDADHLAGPAEKANRVGEGLFTRYPHGEARKQIVAALQAELAH